MKIIATVVADTLSPQGHRLTTLQITFPRIILAEAKTHRILSQDNDEIIIQEKDISLNAARELSKNSASSRAIPSHKMIAAVTDNPFIPIAWQKEHKGMQGTEYFEAVVDIGSRNTVWLAGRDWALEEASMLNGLGVTKQLCNRPLETYMWHTCLISGTEWENFFELRCPQYVVHDMAKGDVLYRSRKDLLKSLEGFPHIQEEVASRSEVQWLQGNKGQAEIHMMALAEAIWDAMNESGPTLRYAGQWHIPFRGKIDGNLVDETIEQGKIFAPGEYNTIFDVNMIKIATAMAARTSYTIMGDEKEISYERLIAIHDTMAKAKPFHASPFEHCARVMTDQEYTINVKGIVPHIIHLDSSGNALENQIDKDSLGWCRNFRGFIQYRHILESQE